MAVAGKAEPQSSHGRCRRRPRRLIVISCSTVRRRSGGILLRPTTEVAAVYVSLEDMVN